MVDCAQLLPPRRNLDKRVENPIVVVYFPERLVLLVALYKVASKLQQDIGPKAYLTCFLFGLVERHAILYRPLDHHQSANPPAGGTMDKYFAILQLLHRI